MKFGTGVAVAVMAAVSLGAWAALKPPPGTLQPPSTVGAPRSPKLTPPVGLQPPASLLVQGRVPGATGVGTLVLRVGEATSTQSVALPDFTFTVPGTAPDAMVSIEVETPGVKRSSILGSYRLLGRQGGRDAVLALGESDRVVLRPLLTALHFHVREQLGGRDPSSDVEHERAIRSVPPDVALGASLLEAVEAGTVALPAEYPHAYALMADEPRFRQLMRVEPAINAGSSAALSRASGIAMAASSLPSALALVGDAVYDDVQTVERGTSVVLKVADGYEIHDNNASRRSPVFTLEQVDTEVVRLVPRAPVYYHTRAFKQLPNGQVVQVLAKYTLESTAFRRQFVGTRYSLWSEQSRYVASYPDHPELADEVFANWRLKTAIELGMPAMRFFAADVAGRRGLPRFCVGSDVAGEAAIFSCGFSQHTFVPRGFGIVEDGSRTVDAAMRPAPVFTSFPFSWNVAALGALQVQRDGISVRYWRIERGAGPVDGIVYVASSVVDGTAITIAGQAAIIDGRMPPAYSASLVVGTWRFATAEQQRGVFEVYNGPTESRLIRRADGSAEQTQLQPEISPDATRSFSSWELFAGRLYDTRYKANATPIGGVGFASCEAAFALGATQCGVAQVRDFLPLARVGNRLYGIEHLHQNAGGYETFPLFYTYPRATYLELVVDEDIESPPIAPMSDPRGRTTPPR